MSPSILLFALLLVIPSYAYATKASAPAHALYLPPVGNTDSPYFKGGKIDAYYDHKDNGDFLVNSILWTPVFKGGHGVQISATGAQEILQGDSKQTEVQGEYRLPSGLGFGGGFVDRSLSNQDIKFAKMSYRNEWQSIKYIVSTQWQSFQGRDYPGGYVALYNKQLMTSWGSDGEQWRSTVGYVGPDQGLNELRPGIEMFYVDNTIGQVNGSKDMMVTGSLGFRKGFLGHESRLGRAMGPTGVEFSNPLGYLNPNFNRRLTAWEVGDFINFRFIHKTLPNSGREETLETAIYPGQLLRTDSLIDALFVGIGATSPNPGQHGVSGLLGYHKRIDNIESSFRVQHDFDRETHVDLF